MRYLLAFLFTVASIHAQEKLPFADEVLEIQRKTDSLWDSSRKTIVFTGSSSIRLWTDLQDRFPNDQVLNTGFGGSQSSDLENYMDELILNYNPVKVFIYEGDNDINDKKRPRAIVDTFVDILEHLRGKKPELEIVLISAKPSISRWHLKRRYIRLNRKLNKLATKMAGVHFADVWTIMLDKRKLKNDLFIEDGLHMNTKGYDLWFGVLKKYMNPNNP